MFTELENAAKRVVGVKQVRRAMADGRTMCLFMARDADSQILAPLKRLAAEQNVEVRWVDTMRELGRVCGITVGATVAAALKG